MPSVISAAKPVRVDFSDLVDVLQRRWLLIALIFAASVAAAMGAAFIIPSQYDAVARVRIDPNPTSAINDESKRSAMPDQAVIDSEVSIMRSREIASGVTRRLGLDQRGEFAAAVKPGVTGGERIEQVNDQLLSRLAVTREPETYVVDIRFRALDPIVAASVANAFTEEYLQFNLRRHNANAEKQAEWLNGRLKEVGQSLTESDEKVARFRAQAGIVEGGQNGTVTDQQIGPLTSELAMAQASAAQARATLASARAQVARNGLDGFSGIAGSEVITNLLTQRAQIAQARANANALNGPNHPTSVKLESQLATINGQLQQELNRIYAGLEAAASAADAKASSLRGQLGQLRAAQANNTRSAVLANNIQLKADSQRSMYNQLAGASLQANQESRGEQAQAVVVEQATAPLRASWPRKPLFGIMGVLLGIALSLATVTLLELRFSGVRTVQDVEQGLGISFLGSLPLLSARNLKEVEGDALTPPDYLRRRPMSRYAEGVRGLRNTLAMGGKRFKGVVAIASAIPSEGKSTTAASLARVMALSGDRVILVDCDLRRGSLGDLLQTKPTHGLRDVLAGKCSIEAAVRNDVVEGLDVLSHQDPSFTTEDIFGSDEMKRLVAQLASRYDCVILDTPPILAVAEARTLCGMADEVIMVTRWVYSPLRAVRAALGILEQDGIRPRGIILSMTSAKSKALGADNPAYYDGYSRKYYTA